VDECGALVIGALLNRRILSPDSNMCYGEGGAGTWSDGRAFLLTPVPFSSVGTSG